MKNTPILWIILAFALFCITGCSSAPVSYTFAGKESTTATIDFVKQSGSGVKFLDFEGRVLPDPKKGTHWGPVVFPAEKEFYVKVNVYDKGRSPFQALSDAPLPGLFLPGLFGLLNLFMWPESYRRIVNRNVYFACPPLEAGGEYRVVFKSRTIKRDSLVLMDRKTRKNIYEQQL